MKTFIRKRKTIEKEEKQIKTSVVINRNPNRVHKLPFGENLNGKKLLKRLI